MPYNIENIFICLAAPFLLAALGTNTGNRKNYIFIVLGFVCCIISAYLNTFFRCFTVHRKHLLYWKYHLL